MGVLDRLDGIWIVGGKFPGVGIPTILVGSASGVDNMEGELGCRLVENVAYV